MIVSKTFVFCVYSLKHILVVSFNNCLSLCVVYFETYGCQMNVNDTEIAWSILKDSGYKRTTTISKVRYTHNSTVEPVYSGHPVDHQKWLL